eukprot:TRINITY_DN24472_c0_g1_i1.p1 TRINITY_DN24472_c0_g1~~TRINITY_DN24472_c0_g1_i1.p1  ORF type:complete len:142 (+),score=27.25 TRINITY_DN24472_c0_g1_i1:85-510(+)
MCIRDRPNLRARGYESPLRDRQGVAGGAALATVVQGLRPRTAYRFQVQACNGSAKGCMSSSTAQVLTRERHSGGWICKHCGQAHNTRCPEHTRQWSCCGSSSASSVYCPERRMSTKKQPVRARTTSSTASPSWVKYTYQYK